MKLAATQMSFFADRTKARKLPPPIERKTHIAVADLLRKTIMPGWIWHHYPIGENRNEETGALLKRMGARAGVADFELIAPPAARYHALELKRKGYKPTVLQAEFLAEVEACGGRSAWTDSFNGAVEILAAWGAIRKVQSW